MKLWEATDVVCCYNVDNLAQTKRIRFVHLPEEPDPVDILAFGNLLLNILPESHSMDSVQLIKRTRYF